MEPSSLSYFEYRLSVIIRNFTTSSDYSIIHHKSLIDQITESQYRFNHDLSKELHPQLHINRPIFDKSGRAAVIRLEFPKSLRKCKIKPHKFRKIAAHLPHNW